MKECPYCTGEIPDQAKKCKHCWERVEKWNVKESKVNHKTISNQDKKETDKNTWDKIATRWIRFMAFLTDTCLMFTIIWWLINLYYVFAKHTTLWNMWAWIWFRSLDWNKADDKKILYRLFTYYPIPIWILTDIWLIIWAVSSIPVDGIVGLFASIFFILNLIELFFKEPTFIEKRIWVKRIQEKEPRRWLLFIFLILFLILARLASIANTL